MKIAVVSLLLIILTVACGPPSGRSDIKMTDVYGTWIGNLDCFTNLRFWLPRAQENLANEARYLTNTLCKRNNYEIDIKMRIEFFRDGRFAQTMFINSRKYDLGIHVWTLKVRGYYINDPPVSVLSVNNADILFLEKHTMCGNDSLDPDSGRSCLDKQ